MGCEVSALLALHGRHCCLLTGSMDSDAGIIAKGM
jgi:hypothetical protein